MKIKILNPLAMGFLSHHAGKTYNCFDKQGDEYQINEKGLHHLYVQQKWIEQRFAELVPEELELGPFYWVGLP